VTNKKNDPANPLFSAKKEGRQSSRQFHRFPLKHLHNISFELGKERLPVAIFNISLGGLGIFHKDYGAIPDSGNLSGNIVIDDKRYGVELRIIYKSKEVMGCSFENPSATLLQGIEKYFEIELAALKMNYACLENASKQSENITFLHGNNNCELLIREIDGIISSFSFVFFGNYFEGKQGKVSVIGQRADDATVNEKMGVSIFRRLPGTDRSVILNAVRLIESVEFLSQKQKESLVTSFETCLLENSK